MTTPKTTASAREALEIAREALAPFAEEIDVIEAGFVEDNELIWNGTDVTGGDTRRAASALSAIDAALAESAGDDGWRDIATAPKDGTKFDGWQGGERVADVYWSDVQEAFCVDGTYGPAEPSPVWTMPPLTHWRPRPAPPAESAGDAKAEPESAPAAEPLPRDVHTFFGKVRKVLAGDIYALRTAFVWAETPQGHEFWGDQYDTGRLSPEGEAILRATLADREG